MLAVVDPADLKGTDLDTYAADAHFTAPVSDLREEARHIAPRLNGRKIWMINSASQGGGVAEMMPRVVTLLRELGFSTEWGVIQTEDEGFFQLTKKLHNMIHGNGSGGVELGAEQARLYEAVNRTNADALKPLLGPNDILIVHDPQPLPLGRMLREELGLKVIWRCHIGLDERTDTTSAVWRFLRPYLKPYDQAAFSAPEYIPSYLTGRASIIYPALDPMSHKNRFLSVHKMTGILCNGGVQTPHEPIPTPDYSDQIRCVQPDGSLAVPGEMGLLFRPIVLQVSRWDRLKGWKPLLEAFARMKERVRGGGAAHLGPRNQRRLELARLVLAGPDPASIQDDPEGVAVFEDLRETFMGLSPIVQSDIAILVLPMSSRKENGLIVNALQRCASVVVQNSLREGFGLTLTEAMWKRQAVLGTNACGLRLQVRHDVDGVLTEDPEDPDEIASRLFSLIIKPRTRHLFGRSARRRVYDTFLIFGQITRYIEMLDRVA